VTSRPCPHCYCEDSCGREGGTRPPSFFLLPDVFDVYAALTAYHSQDPMILEEGTETVAKNLVRLGYLNHRPLLVDVESSLDIIRSVERVR
jgi:hypothetical protein